MHTVSDGASLNSCGVKQLHTVWLMHPRLVLSLSDDHVLV